MKYKNLLIWYQLTRPLECGLPDKVLTQKQSLGGKINFLIPLRKFQKVFYIWPKTKTIENLFNYLDYFSTLIPIFLFVQYWKQSYPKVGLRLVFFYQIVILLVGSMIYMNRNSLILYELYTLLEAAAFIVFLFTQITNGAVRKAVLVIGLLFIAFSIVFFRFNDSVRMFDSLTSGIETIIVLVFSFYFLYEKTNDTKTLYIYSTFPFWIVTGMVLYMAGSFFIFIYADSLTGKELFSYWIVTNVLSIMKNIFFAIAIFVNTKPSKNIPMSGFELSSLN